MKTAVALVLAAAALAGCLALRPAPRETPPAAPPPPPAAPAPAPLAAPPGNDVRLLALTTSDLLAQGRPEAQDSAALLRGRLQQEPQLWGEVLDVLCSIDDPRTVIRLTGTISEALDPAAEARLLELLGTGSTPHARRIAVAGLIQRRSSESLDALITAAQSDTDRAVRLDALKALALRRDHAASPEGALAITDVFARRAQGEPDPELRNVARRLSGEVLPEDVPPPAPPRRPRVKVPTVETKPR